jgi:signal transduction histidine kinase
VARRPGETGVQGKLENIAETCREVLDNVGDLVWALNGTGDQWSVLVGRMRSFSTQIFEASDVEFRFDCTGIPMEHTLGPEALRHLYLVFKEAVNNAARHSGCSAASASLHCAHGRLVMTIADNGRGFQPAAGPDHHGIESLRSRAVALKGTITWTSEKGTTVVMQAPLPD